MDSEQIRDHLHGEEHRLQEIREDLRNADELDEPMGSSAGELSVADQHPADIATEENQRSIDLSMLEQVEAELTDVERALRKLDDGSYGTCEACGQQIDEERLQALPATRFCIQDQQQAEADVRNTTSSVQQAETTAYGESTPI